MGVDKTDCFVDLMDRPVYVSKRTLLQTLGKPIIFFVGNVLMSLLQELAGAVQPARVIQPGIHRRVVVQILAIVDGSLLDF